MSAEWGGIEAGGTKFVCAVGTPPGRLSRRTEFPTTTPKETLDAAVQFFSDYGLERIENIGIASFGPVDLDPDSPTCGFITSTPKPHWKNTDFLGIINRATGKKAAFDTDVNAAALAEGKWGAARGLKTFVYFTVGTGIGAGVVAEGRIVHGLLHPEAGHMRIPHDLTRDPFRGICPYHGDCLEGLAAGPSIEARWGMPARDVPPGHQAWDLQASYLAAAVVNTICMLSPRRIILGGGVMHQPELLPLVREHVRRLLAGYIQLPDLMEGIENYIVSPALGNDAGIMGALLLAQG